MKTVSSHLKQTPQSLLDVQLQGYLCKVKKKTLVEEKRRQFYVYSNYNSNTSDLKNDSIE